MSANPNRPVMFPCATQVSLIQVGADDFDLKVNSRVGMQTMKYSGRKWVPPKSADVKESVKKPVLRRVSEGMSFSEEVVREMAPYTIPYNEQSIYDAYDTSEFLSQAEKKMKLPSGRFNNYGPDRRHLSCHFKKTAPYKLKPIKREIMRRALEMHKQALQKEEKSTEISSSAAEKPGVGVFLTEAPDKPGKEADTPDKNPHEEKASSDSADDKESSTKEKHQWDEYLLSILSKPTAQWIVTQRTDPTERRYKPLYEFMVGKHGVPSSTELVRDDMAEYEDTPKPKPVTKEVVRRPNTQSARLLRPVHEMQEAEKAEKLDTVPYSDANKASFYRKPGGIKKKIKIQQKEMGALNTTATSIIVKKQELPPPPKLRDFVDPRITENTVYETENNFQRDWLTGNKQVYQVFGDSNEIVMENHNKYSKVCQIEYPRHTGEWYPEGGGLPDARSPRSLVHKTQTGQNRWTGLPKSVEESSVMIAGVVEEVEQNMNSGTEKFQPSEALSRIVDEWRAKWHLNMRFNDATPEELIKDMEDIHPHVRIKAISTCARAACYKPPPLEGIELYSVNKTDKTQLPEQIFVALNCLLDDEHAKVQLAAAIALHALHRPNDRAEEVLRFNLQPDQNKADRWAAVQCLGLYGMSDSDVIGECVGQMMSTEDMIQYERACSLLSHISNNTNLVHSMLAEHLNDCSWRHRVMALKCLPKLYGDINVDIQNKVMHLMWNDTHSDVRKAAAQSLGKCGHGRLVHDKLREILIEGTQSERAETLSKIGFLGIMTAKLMLPFMKSFRDEYVSVRKEACIAAGNLRIQDESLMSELLRLCNRDPIWRIKALAIQALGKIGVATAEVRNALLWALRFEEEEGVRAESCHSIILLQLKDKEVLEILQNRMLVEESPVVQEELAIALELNGVSATEDMAMVAKIKAEVRKLSNRNDIYNSICQLEDQEQIIENTKQMIYIPPTPKTSVVEPPEDNEEEPLVVIDQVANQQAEGNRRPVSRSMKTYTTVSEPIPEEDEEDEENVQDNDAAQSQRQPSAISKTSRSLRASAKSRPVSGSSSLNTDVLDTELEEVMRSKLTSREAPTEASGSYLSPRLAKDARDSCMSTRPSTGYEKKRLNESRAVTVTPTVLSITMDQVEAIHSDAASVSGRMKTLSVQGDVAEDKMSLSSSHMKPLEMEQSPSTQTSLPATSVMQEKTTDDITQGENFTNVKAESQDPVEKTRYRGTSFLFDRYSHIDVKSPDAFSPLPANTAES